MADAEVEIRTGEQAGTVEVRTGHHEEVGAGAGGLGLRRGLGAAGAGQHKQRKSERARYAPQRKGSKHFGRSLLAMTRCEHGGLKS
jgi:hypothetical protein